MELQSSDEEYGPVTSTCLVRDLEKGKYILLKGFPCLITEVNVLKAQSKESKIKLHKNKSSAKKFIAGTDIFTGKKYEDTLSCSYNVDVPIIKKKEYELISIDGYNYVTLMSLDDESLREDLKLPTVGNRNSYDEPDLKKDLVEGIKYGIADDKRIVVTVLSAMNMEMIVNYMERKN